MHLEMCVSVIANHYDDAGPRLVIHQRSYNHTGKGFVYNLCQVIKHGVTFRNYIYNFIVLKKAQCYFKLPTLKKEWGKENITSLTQKLQILLFALKTTLQK